MHSLLLVLIAVALLGGFVLDGVTPLGWADWIQYLIPVAVFVSSSTNIVRQSGLLGSGQPLAQVNQATVDVPVHRGRFDIRREAAHGLRVPVPHVFTVTFWGKHSGHSGLKRSVHESGGGFTTSAL